jgi:hypothetical protein
MTTFIAITTMMIPCRAVLNVQLEVDTLSYNSWLHIVRPSTQIASCVTIPRDVARDNITTHLA